MAMPPHSLSRLPAPHFKKPVQVRTNHVFGVQSFTSLENLFVQDKINPVTDSQCLKTPRTNRNDNQLPRRVNTGKIEMTPKGMDIGNDFNTISDSNKGQWLEDQEPKDSTAQSRSLENQSKELDLWDEDEDETCSEYNFDDPKNESFQETLSTPKQNHKKIQKLIASLERMATESKNVGQ